MKWNNKTIIGSYSQLVELQKGFLGVKIERTIK
jgi:hypothetical protein